MLSQTQGYSVEIRYEYASELCVFVSEFTAQPAYILPVIGFWNVLGMHGWFMEASSNFML